MKKKGNCCEFTHARNRELREAFRTVLRQPSMLDTRQIFSVLASAPASRFFISENRACTLIRHHRKSGQWSSSMVPLRRKMMEEIDRRVSARQTANPKESLPEAVFHVINSPAPSFYLTPGSIKTILYAAGLASC